jgi:prephenate dehydratase
MRNHLIAIQGSVSSFHDLAAKKYFGEEVTTVECNSFKEVCDKLANNQVDYGIIAIENKVAGSILMNYQLIDSFDLTIIGEIYLPIKLQLLGNEGTKMSDIKEIISHPMALGQSQLFLSSLTDITVSEFKDTATSAKLVKEDSSNQLAVIAGPKVGEEYGLKVIEESVADEKINFTRFYILSKGADVEENPTKASVTLQTHNQVGGLSDVLNVLKNANLNLTKIQSVPIINNPTSYAFHLDIEFLDKTIFDDALSSLIPITESLKVLGIYKGENLPIN